MSLEPAIALVIGLVLLHQLPGAAPLTGIAGVVAAGLGAERSAAHTVPTRATPSEMQMQS